MAEQDIIWEKGNMGLVLTFAESLQDVIRKKNQALVAPNGPAAWCTPGCCRVAGQQVLGLRGHLRKALAGLGDEWSVAGHWEPGQQAVGRVQQEPGPGVLPGPSPARGGTEGG
ncbi:Hypothetical predicted protein [Marmota monax]|uniref:Uncharacterized protein n=1 Tax=Marmota monax TaxID=9995 RepID=A0A5E4A0T5_MARMO|nr:hypothetical protein GHT09_002118 [Marmota monax]VTJ50725.1 Hypothetical predicted protein [Marmota monax]